MNLLGSRSLSSILGLLLNVMLIGVCVIIVLLAVALPLALMGGPTNVTIQLPASFTINPSAYQLTVPRNPNVTAEIQSSTRSNVIIHGGSRTLAVLTILVLLPATVVAAIVLFRLRRIFRRL